MHHHLVASAGWICTKPDRSPIPQNRKAAGIVSSPIVGERGTVQRDPARHDSTSQGGLCLIVLDQVSGSTSSGAVIHKNCIITYSPVSWVEGQSYGGTALRSLQTSELKVGHQVPDHTLEPLISCIVRETGKSYRSQNEHDKNNNHQLNRGEPPSAIHDHSSILFPGYHIPHSTGSAVHHFIICSSRLFMNRNGFMNNVNYGRKEPDGASPLFPRT